MLNLYSNSSPVCQGVINILQNFKLLRLGKLDGIIITDQFLASENCFI